MGPRCDRDSAKSIQNLNGLDPVMQNQKVHLAACEPCFDLQEDNGLGQLVLPHARPLRDMSCPGRERDLHFVLKKKTRKLR